jgi:hypothetical protein
MVSRVSGGAAQSAPERAPAASGARNVLAGLFPGPAPASPRSLGWRVASAALQVVGVALGAGLLLLRIPGVPPWDSLYLDDFGTFYVRALQHPWQLFSPQHGYVQVVPHLVAQLAAQVPLRQVPVVFAVFGALTAAACGLYVFHASAGHIRSVKLRALLGAAIVLLPVTPLEIADNTLGAPWYMLLALFWAVLWRPRTRAGMTVTAVLAFACAASTSIAVLYAPLLALRLYVLRRPREHAVTAGWLAGCLTQLPVIMSSYAGGKSPLDTPSASGKSLAFYAHDVVLPSLGWHLSWWLQSLAGRDGATAIVAAVLAVVFAMILITQPRSRLLVAAALLFGFGFTMFCEALVTYPSTSPPVMPDAEWGARYTALPVFLIQAAILAGAGSALRKRERSSLPAGGGRPAPARVATVATVAVVALIAVIMVSWVPDFRYPNSFRLAYTTGRWEVVVAQWRLDCAISWTGEIRVKDLRAIPAPQTIPCARVHF